MRISDWSSDVCSSDLHGRFRRRRDQDRAAGRGRAVPDAQPPAGDAEPPLHRRQPDEEESRPRPEEARGSRRPAPARSEEHTSELQSLMRISYAVFGLKKKQTRTLYVHTEEKHSIKT